ncbi:MAG: glycerophosphodiester phosphodiesterase family protein [bacterium]
MRGFRLSIAFLLAGTLTSAEVTAQTPARRQRPIFTQDFRMVAHRGGAALFPENTLEAFRAAAARWPTAVIETDVRLTADGVPVLIHDPTVDRTTNGKGAVAAQPLAELARLDAAYRFSTDGDRTFPSRGRGVRIPTLEEAPSPRCRTRVSRWRSRKASKRCPDRRRHPGGTGEHARGAGGAARGRARAGARARVLLVATNFDENAVREIVKLVRGGHPDDRPPWRHADGRATRACRGGVRRYRDRRPAGRRHPRAGVHDRRSRGDEAKLLAEGFTSLVTNRPDGSPR